MAPDTAPPSEPAPVTATAALPFYVQVIKTGRNKWGYRCEACTGIWPYFTTEDAAHEFAALHVKESHDGC